MNDLTFEKEDFGVVLYEKSNAKHALDAPTGKVSPKALAQRIYMILLAVVLFGWFLYSVINMATDPEEGLVNSLVSHSPAFFVLLVAEFILMLTAFNAWGKFARMAFKRGLARQHGREGMENRRLEEELATADANKKK